ncbi:MAG TPA: divergent polysaccharide deacetylase family protein, partial [Thermoanaerobaculia bacterium]|nr:divergent polysaccharide deacetylase family protein [Thermoanaerobaculia bacterium]
DQQLLRLAIAPFGFEPAGVAAPGVVAVLLDDVGYEEGALSLLAAFEQPLAVSVLPGTPRAAAAAALAKRKGWDLMVHLPMEPETGKAEPNSIGTGDDDAAIRARVLAALAAVPGASGLNNHQGSKATADPRVMRAVLAVVKERGLFYLDSRTTPATTAERIAREMRVPFLVRDVFLDDAAAEAKDPAGPAGALPAAWERALALAARNGRAVVIAHPHRESVEFLARALPELARRGPRPVRLTELLD